jgi:hypothetical protein
LSDDFPLYFDYPDAVKVDYLCSYFDYGFNSFISANSYNYKIYIYNQTLKLIDSIYQGDFNVQKLKLLSEPIDRKKDITESILNLDSQLGRIISIKLVNPKKVIVIYIQNKSRFMDIWQKEKHVWKKQKSAIKVNDYDPMAMNEKYLNQNNFIHTLNHSYSFWVKNEQLVTLSPGPSYFRGNLKKEQLNQYYKDQVKNPCLNIDRYEIND